MKFKTNMFNGGKAVKAAEVSYKSQVMMDTAKKAKIPFDCVNTDKGEELWHHSDLKLGEQMFTDKNHTLDYRLAPDGTYTLKGDNTVIKLEKGVITSFTPVAKEKPQMPAPVATPKAVQAAMPDVNAFKNMLAEFQKGLIDDFRKVLAESRDYDRPKEEMKSRFR